MNPPSPFWLIGLPVVGVAITGFVAYLATKAQRSGTVRTSQADDLWAEGRAMRDVLLAQIETFVARIDMLEAKITSLEGKLDAALDALREEKRK